MVELRLYGREVESVFQLLGEQENDVSYSVGWALSRCPSFLQGFLKKVGASASDTQNVLIRLQQYGKDKGFTDVEIESIDRFFMIAEAKRGWNLPDCEQLKRYVGRLRESAAPFERLIILSECSKEYAEANLGVHNIAGVPIEPVSWKEVANIARSALQEGSHAERRLLRELLTYLGGIVSVQNLNSNWVYVVALAKGTPPGSDITWVDIVRKRNYYFHPIGGKGRWPKEPPNYIAFRYDGRLQSLHRVGSYEVINNAHDRIPEMKDERWDEPYFLYTLGPAFGPDKKVKTGKVYRNGRVWCMLDTLFTCETVSEARDLSKEREEKFA